MALTEAEIQATLVKIKTAIDATLDGRAASLSIAGRTWPALRLKELREMLAWYERRLAIAQAGGLRPSAVRFVKSGGTF